MNILELRDIHTFIGPFHILQGVSLTVPRGSITALLGRNGAGKPAPLKSIMGMTPPRTGEILFDGRPVHGLRSFEIASQGIGFVPDYRAVFRDLTVEENMQLAERRKGDYARKRDQIFSLFPDLLRLKDLRGNELSGGQQQMLAIARALVPDNRLLLVDEPTEGLAPVVIEQLMDAIRELSKNTTVLLVEQNFVVASRLAQYYVIVEEGRTAKSGPMGDLLAQPDVIKRFLGAA